MPFRHRSFTVTGDGALLPDQAERRPSVRFDWRGRRCVAELEAGGITVAAIAARVPSTAERHADRTHAFATLAAVATALPDGWRLRLLPDHRVRLQASAAMPQAPTASRLVAAMVRFALVLDPLLDRLEAAGAGLPATAAER